MLEVGVAIALLPAASAGRGALGALILLGAFTLGIVTVLVRGRQADCRLLRAAVLISPADGRCSRAS